jgi:hypothetical protein
MAKSPTQPGNKLIKALEALMDLLNELPDPQREQIAQQILIIRDLTSERFDELEKQAKRWPYMPIW